MHGASQAAIFEQRLAGDRRGARAGARSEHPRAQSDEPPAPNEQQLPTYAPPAASSAGGTTSPQLPTSWAEPTPRVERRQLGAMHVPKPPAMRVMQHDVTRRGQVIATPRAIQTPGAFRIGRRHVPYCES